MEYIKAGEEVILEAIAFNYPSVAERHIPEIQWEMIVVWEGATEKIGTGKTIRYKVDKKYAGKKIIFRAYINKDSSCEFPLQKIECQVENEAPEHVLIQEVTGAEKGFIGETVELQVTKYNIDEKKLTITDKNAIKWDVKIGNDAKKVFVNTLGV